MERTLKIHKNKKTFHIVARQHEKFFFYFFFIKRYPSRHISASPRVAILAVTRMTKGFTPQLSFARRCRPPHTPHIYLAFASDTSDSPHNPRNQKSPHQLKLRIAFEHLRLRKMPQALDIRSTSTHMPTPKDKSRQTSSTSSNKSPSG